MTIQELINQLQSIPADKRDVPAVIWANDGDGTLYELESVEPNVVGAPLSDANPLAIMSGDETFFPALFHPITGEQI